MDLSNSHMPTPEIDDAMTHRQHETLRALVSGLFRPNAMGHWRKFDDQSRVLTVGSGPGLGIKIAPSGAIVGKGDA